MTTFEIINFLIFESENAMNNEFSLRYEAIAVTRDSPNSVVPLSVIPDF